MLKSVPQKKGQKVSNPFLSEVKKDPDLVNLFKLVNRFHLREKAVELFKQQRPSQ